jgi:hypothetical protein
MSFSLSSPVSSAEFPPPKVYHVRLITLIILCCSSLILNCLSVSLSFLLVGDIRNVIPQQGQKSPIVRSLLL